MNSRLTADYFTEQAIFDRETDRLFNTHWLCAARSDKVQNPGDLICVEIEKASLLVVRGDDRRLRAMHNVCRHRGAILRQEDGRIDDDGCVTCAYHAWAYDSSGGLVRAPNMQQQADFDAGQFGLHPVECVEWNGYVMVRLGDGQTFEDAFAPVKEKYDPWSMADLVVGHTLEYDVAANWKLLFHNYSECYHCPTVHPALNRLTPYKSAENDLLAGAFLGGPMQLGGSAQSMTMDGSAVTTALAKLNEEQKKQVSFYTLCPTMFISPHPDFVLVHRLQRVAVDRSRIVCEFLVDPHSANGGTNLASAVEFWDMTNRQDWEVCELVQKGAQTTGFTPGIYSPLETVLPLFDEYYLATMA